MPNEQVTFEQLVNACNRAIWMHLYPDGRCDFASLQHRDVVRVFFIGVMETLIARNDKSTARGLWDEYEKLCQPDWMPDERFKPCN